MGSDYRDILSRLGNTPRGVNEKILIIDGMNTVIRSFATVKALNQGGHHIGGVVGFLRSLGYLIRIIDPTRVICVFDGQGGSTNRKNINPEYKAQRKHVRITNWGVHESKGEEMDSLFLQAEKTQEYLEYLPVHTILLDKLEADDIIAYLAKAASKNGKKSIIVSSDKDFFQLLDENISIYYPIRSKVTKEGKLFTKSCKETRELIGVLPENYNILKCLLKDTSDNLKGVKGAGVKTLVKEFPELVDNPNLTLQDICRISEEKLGGKKIFAKILDNWDKVERNYEIMNLHETVLDDSEKQFVDTIIKSPIPELRIGEFLTQLSADGIERITNDTVGWLQGFAYLKQFNK